MKGLQTELFRSEREISYRPVVVAYGAGVDSTAVLIGMQKRGIRPDAILFADTGDEKDETYNYLPIIGQWLQKVGFPPITVVRYRPQKKAGTMPYDTLGENCLANGTLPSLAFGFKSCSLKWKVLPQNQWLDRWLPARDCWKAGNKVIKVIGYDASPNDVRRYAHVKDMEDPKYSHWYPLIEWQMDREACKQLIRDAGLPVPPKSACKFCPATRPSELLDHHKAYLRFIVIMEANARPKLQGCMDQRQLDLDYQQRMEQWQARLDRAAPREKAALQEKKPKPKKEGSGCAGLWRKATSAHPAMMTDFILQRGLLPAQEVESLRKLAPAIIVSNRQAFQQGHEMLSWHDFLEMFTPEDGLDETLKKQRRRLSR